MMCIASVSKKSFCLGDISDMLYPLIFYYRLIELYQYSFINYEASSILIYTIIVEHYLLRYKTFIMH